MMSTLRAARTERLAQPHYITVITAEVLPPPPVILRSSGKIASPRRGRSLRCLGNDEGKLPLRIEECDLEGRVYGFPRLLAGRPAGVEVGGAGTPK
jgi:hypothetical protein